MSILLKYSRLLILPLLLLASCDKKEEPKGDKDKKEDKKAEAKELKASLETADDIEKFTGEHTRVVWMASSRDDRADPFGVSDKNVLRGVDTADGKGVRDVLEEDGNYARPLLNDDGTVILFTDKNIKKDGHMKSYKPVIYSTDWKGGKPKKLAEGYALDVWKDPATGVEWVYAAQKLVTSPRIAIEAKQLVRFQLQDPSKEELVYDDTPIGTDNIQLSRDGTRASGLFPWPHCGVFHIKDGQWTAKKLLTGCWPSMAPDNSGVSWVFDGSHRNATVFADDKRPHWSLVLNTDKKMKKAEVYHPRWSNHARFVAVTGPYIKTTNEKGSVIGKGGISAEIYLAKLDDKATKVEEWLAITDDKRGDAYPDVWIAGGEKSSLAGFQIAEGSDDEQSVAWPMSKEGLLMLWKDRESLNSFHTREGQKLETRMDSRDAARFGRHSELLLDGGWYELAADSAGPLLKHLGGEGDFTLEALVFPPASRQNGFLWRSPGLVVQWRDGRLQMADNKSAVETADAAPAEPFALLLVRQAGKWDVKLNGEQVAVQETAAIAPFTENQVLLGGGWDGGIMRLAVYDQAPTADMSNAIQQSASALLAQVQPQPSRVKLRAKLVEESAMPTAEGIDPYTGALVAYVYEVEEVLEGEFEGEKVLVKHWAMLGRKNVNGLPHELGKSYELTLELESDHSYLQGERVMDDTLGSLELTPWFDVMPPRVVP